MPLVIQDILPRSLASRKGIKAGDKLLSINGHDIRDFIDLQFYSSDSVLDCKMENKDGNYSNVEIIRNDKTALGIEPETYRYRECVNNCVFCFIDQMPPSLRNSLYIKDDDFIYSFVFGNYISLTNLSDSDYKRIIKQKLSPLYISVHATNPVMRKKMMGYDTDFDVLEKMKKLSKAGIQLHCQIVLIPDWNDDEDFVHTLNDLINPALNVCSIGVVPVGLTKYRKNLALLRTFTPEEAAHIIKTTETFRSKRSINYLYCSDELFIKAGIPIPECDYYQDYPQIENGIGMICLMMENWKEKKRSFLRELRRKNKPLLMVTGLSASGYLEPIASEITRKAECCPARVQPVINNFMGKTVTVSGLLTFEDIKAQVKPEDNEIVALPGNIFNHDGITLDGFSQLDIKEYWQCDILIIDPLFDDWEWI